MLQTMETSTGRGGAECSVDVPSLPPLLDPDITHLLAGQSRKFHDLADRFGSPLNIVWPHILTKNLEKLRRVLAVRNVPAKIFYAAKVNKSHSLIFQAVTDGIGVDVSSLYEFRDAVRAGAGADRICATGPAKPQAFLEELVSYGALISVDSAEELDLISSLLTNGFGKARITLRFRPEVNKDSRFGMGGDEITACLARVASDPRFLFEGFHFHLSGYHPDNRVSAFAELMHWVGIARARGLETKMIDIGGGMPIQYVEKNRYEAFLQSQDSAHYRNGKVPAAFYPYGGQLDASTWLAAFLDAPCLQGETVGELLKKEKITLGLEPGRCLADQTAVTLFRVARTKKLHGGHHVLFAQGSSFSACETWFNSEFLIDPVHLPRISPSANGSSPCRAYIAGHSCLDDDVITNRRIAFRNKPLAGDLLLYANTAGYQMDLLENEFHRVPMPRRIAVNHDLTKVVADDQPGEVE